MDLPNELEDFLGRETRLALPRSEAPQVSILLVVHNQAEYTFRCLTSILQTVKLPYEVLLMDNASSDLTEVLLSRVDGITLLRNQQNLHFIKACNQGLLKARGESVLLLNNDAELLPDAVAQAWATLGTSPDIGAVGGKVVTPTGKLQEAGGIIWRDGKTSGYGRNQDPDRPEFCFCRDVDYCSACFLMVRRDLLVKLDGFDESYCPAYYEDADLCMRIRRASYRVVYEPRAVVSHREFTSSDSPVEPLRLQRQNQIVFRQKHQTVLDEHHLPLFVRNLPRARSRAATPDTKRVLVIGFAIDFNGWAGTPGAAASLVNSLQAQGHLLTCLLCFAQDPDSQSARFPPEVEMVPSPNASLLSAFFYGRIQSFDTIIATRPGLMELVQKFVTGNRALREQSIIRFEPQAGREPTPARSDSKIPWHLTKQGCAEVHSDLSWAFAEASDLPAALQHAKTALTHCSNTELRQRLNRMEGYAKSTKRLSVANLKPGQGKTVMIVCDRNLVPVCSGNQARIVEFMTALRELGVHVVLLVRAVPENLERCKLLEAMVDQLALMEGPVMEHAQTIKDFDATAYREIVQTAATLCQPAMVVAEYAWMAGCLEGLPSHIVKCVDTHDCFHHRSAKYDAQGVHPWVYCDAAEESAALAPCDVILAIQANEARRFRELCPDKQVICVGHSTADIAEPPPVTASEAPTVLIIGGKNEQNLRGLESFLAVAWPMIRNRIPEARLRIGGLLGELVPNDLPGVDKLGFLPDLDSPYSEADVVINPAIMGTGLKIKTVEALCRGKALLTTTPGADGLESGAGAAYWLENDFRRFGQAVIQLLENPPIRRQLELRAVEFAREKFSRRVVYQEILTLLEDPALP